LSDRRIQSEPPAKFAGGLVQQPQTPLAPAPSRLGGAAEPAAAPAAAAGGTDRKLVVGHEIVLSGEIKSCNWLVVQGNVAADIAECRQLEIARSGTFKGAAVIENADIDGLFEGNLTVTGCLRIRASGVVKGAVRYKELAVECGGRLAGDVGVYDGATASRDVPPPNRDVAAPKDDGSVHDLEIPVVLKSAAAR
jgi:cytoskeletal protein CcmA (bactofilin family)